MGFSIVWGVVNLINLAHGTMIVVGAYITFWLFTLAGVDPFLSLPVSMGVMFLVGYALQRWLINLIVRAHLFMTLVLTFAIDIFMSNVILILWTADYRSVLPAYAGWGFHANGLVIPAIRLWVFLASLLVTGALYLFITYTWLGRAIKATGLDREAAELVGVRVRHIYAVTFGLGGALAGAAGALISTLYTFSPVLGGAFTMKAFVIVCLGGLGSMSGAIIGGLLFGLVETAVAFVAGPGVSELTAFLMLVGILLVRPQGIVGKQFFAEVRQ